MTWSPNLSNQLYSTTGGRLHELPVQNKTITFKNIQYYQNTAGFCVML